MTDPLRVPFAPPYIGEEEIQEVVETLRSGWLATGPRVARFERDFAEVIGAENVVATSSCTGALHIALTLLAVRGGEVVLPTMTFGATALAAVHAGARPVLVDIEETTLNMDPEAVEAAMTDQTRAVVAVHYGGLACQIDRILAHAGSRGVRVVEDAAHGIGCESRGRHVGTIGSAGAFSFYANKNLTTIEGGMLVLQDPELVTRARTLRLQGITRDAWRREGGAGWRYDIVEAGFKYPMSDVQAAVGIHQLTRLREWQAGRASAASRYRELLRGVPGVTLFADAATSDRHGNHLFVVRLDRNRADRDTVSDRMRKAGIETSVHFVPLHLHPYFQTVWGYRQGQFPRAEAAFEEILSLPMHGRIRRDEVDRVVEALVEALGAS